MFLPISCLYDQTLWTPSYVSRFYGHLPMCPDFMDRLHKSVINTVSINIDKQYANHEKRNITARKTSPISLTQTTARKNGCRYSLIPSTVTEWNRLPERMAAGTLLSLVL